MLEQLAYHQSAPVEQFAENQDVVDQSASQVAESVSTIPAEADLTPTFEGSMRIIPCLEVVVVDV